MRMIRTALALGALSMSVPAMAQDSRYGFDRSRVERSGDSRGGKNDKRADAGSAKRNDGRGESRGGGRVEPRVDNGNRNGNGNGNRGEARMENRGQGRTDGRVEVRGRPDVSYDRRDRRDEPRVVLRPPVVVDRWGRRDGRFESRYDAYDRRAYRYGDRDFDHRDRLTITAWFRALPPARLAVYGYYDRGYEGVRYSFRPGLYLSMDVFGRLGVLPYDLEMELGGLPWYLERRLYGRTVLVIDVRTRMVVDMYDIDD